MRYKIPLSFSFIILFLFLSGCSGKVNNAITIQNLSSGTIYFNFRGSVVMAISGSTATITEIPKGTYDYSTTALAPAGALTPPTLQGDYKGIVTINAGTKIAVVYSSTLLNGAYSVFATISSSDSQTSTTSP
jgi:hypothetical protein